MLSQLKILDLTSNLPGPYATMLLADLGARVLKIDEELETGKGVSALDVPVGLVTPAVQSVKGIEEIGLGQGFHGVSPTLSEDGSGLARIFHEGS